MRTLKEIRSFYSSIQELKKDTETQTAGLQIKSADEKRFADKHVIKKVADRNGNGDDVFNATKVNGVERGPKHGYNPGEDEKVYEEVDQIDEVKKVVPAGHGFDPERADLDALSQKYKITIKPHPSGGVRATGSRKNVDSFHKDTNKFNQMVKNEQYTDELEEGDVIQFPKRNKKNDEEDRKKPGWMLRQDPELAKKFKDAEERAKQRKKLKEDEAKQFEEAAQLDPDKKAKEAIDTILKKHEAPAGEEGMPFEGPYTKTPEKQPGQKSDPSMSRARHLARQAIVAKEDLEINEVLKPSMGVKAYIDDFVKSDDPRFKGASKKERMKRALAAFYSAKRGD